MVTWQTVLLVNNIGAAILQRLEFFHFFLTVDLRFCSVRSRPRAF
jgi:hypothetical protein